MSATVLDGRSLYRVSSQSYVCRGARAATGLIRSSCERLVAVLECRRLRTVDGAIPVKIVLSRIVYALDDTEWSNGTGFLSAGLNGNGHSGQQFFSRPANAICSPLWYLSWKCARPHHLPILQKLYETSNFCLASGQKNGHWSRDQSTVIFGTTVARTSRSMSGGLFVTVTNGDSVKQTLREASSVLPTLRLVSRILQETNRTACHLINCRILQVSQKSKSLLDERPGQVDQVVRNLAMVL